MSKKEKDIQINKPLEKFGVYDGSAVFIGAYIVMLLLQFLLYIVLTITKVPVGEAENAFDKTVAYACIVVAINEVAFLVAPFLYSKIKIRKVYVGCGLAERVNPTYLLLAAATGLLCLFAFGPVSTLVNSLFANIGFSASVSPSATTVGEFIAYVVISAIVPGFCEEFLFRGHVQRGFTGRGYLFGLLTSSLLFAIMHGSPVQLVYQFFVGAMCGLLYIFTRSLWTSVIAHFTSNLAVLVLDFSLTSAGVNYVTVTGELVGIYAGVTVAGIALLVGAMYLLYRLAAKKRDLYGELKQIKGASPKAWNARLTLLGQTDEERAKAKEEQAFRLSQIEGAATPEIKEMLIQRYESEDKKLNKMDTRGIILCFAIPGVIFILNTILGFVQ